MAKWRYKQKPTLPCEPWTAEEDDILRDMVGCGLCVEFWHLGLPDRPVNEIIERKYVLRPKRAKTSLKLGERKMATSDFGAERYPEPTLIGRLENHHDEMRNFWGEDSGEAGSAFLELQIAIEFEKEQNNEPATRPIRSANSSSATTTQARYSNAFGHVPRLHSAASASSTSAEN